jgi:hypothetical protein
MTLLPRGVKVHFAFGFIDMRKGIDGLAMLVQGVLQLWGRNVTAGVIDHRPGGKSARLTDQYETDRRRKSAL